MATDPKRVANGGIRHVAIQGTDVCSVDPQEMLVVFSVDAER